MSLKDDPFEAFREKRKLEALERHVRSSPAVKCPPEAAPAAGAAVEAKAPPKRPSASRPAFDPDRTWIY